MHSLAHVSPTHHLTSWYNFQRSRQRLFPINICWTAWRRSHAIFTITLEQRKLPAALVRISGGEDGGSEYKGEEEEDGYLCAKMHLVDLAGGAA
jgi:hypothetical protein